MRFLGLFLASLLALLASASPVAVLSAVTYPASVLPPSSFPHFYIRTKLIKKDKSKARYDNLWVSGYHTGAGLNDAVAFSNKSYARPFYVNTTANNSLYGDFGTPFPWGFVMTQATYAGWSFVQVNAGGGDRGFSVTKNKGVIWGTAGCKNKDFCPGALFSGWLVCDWYHGVPQLFWRNKYYNTTKYPTPSSCADAYLRPIAVKK